MKREDAAKILGLNGNLDFDTIKAAYRRACSKFHPDRNPAGEEMMKAVNEAWETLKDFQGQVDAGLQGFDDALNAILNELVTMAGLIVEVCGAWVWVTGDTKAHKEKLGKNGLGLYWASKKCAWYFRPEDWKSSSKGAWSLDTIREKHGSKIVAGGQKLIK